MADQEITSGTSGRSRRGFASMDPARQREIASKGGRAAHEKGTAHEWSSDEARTAGQKGGITVSRDRTHMANIGREGGVIINTGSITGLEGSKTLLDYSATKGAIHAFTKSLAQQLVERKIRVNCVAPGPVWTPLNPQSKSAEQVAEFGQDTPMKRAAQPEEMAPAFVFFASTADSSYISGEVLTLLGGQTTAG